MPYVYVTYQCGDVVARTITYDEFTGTYLAHCGNDELCRVCEPRGGRPANERSSAVFEWPDWTEIQERSARLWRALDSKELWTALKADEKSDKLLDALKKALRERPDL